jgi:hypothetical protein
LIGGALAGVALTIPAPGFFQWTLAFFWLLAFSSATHDIAADGYYLLATTEKEQAFFVGIRSTFYRVAMVSGQGLLVILAGYVQSHTGLPKVELQVMAKPGVALVESVKPESFAVQAASEGELRVFVQPASLEISPQSRTKAEVNAVVRLTQRDELDAALVSIVEVLFHDRYDVLDGIAIASLGEVQSVLLAHRKPLAEATEWLERYREFWEESYLRLDALLDEMKLKEKKRERKKR